MASAMIVVDVQNDFCEGGSLAVAGGADVASAISERLRHDDVDVVVATRDHHVDPGDHFSDRPDFVDSWPPHCVVGTPGVELHPNLDRRRLAAVFDKGEYAAAYSGFEGRTGASTGSGSTEGMGLAQWLRSRDVDRVEIVGIATDHCVRATALDAVAAGFDTTVDLSLTAAVSPDTLDRALPQLRAAGVHLTGEVHRPA